MTKHQEKRIAFVVCRVLRYAVHAWASVARPEYFKPSDLNPSELLCNCK